MNKPLLPPVKRTPVWQSISEAAAEGKFILPVCKHCSLVQYPPRELCGHCLHDQLQWKEVTAEGTLMSFTELHVSTNAFFRQHLPRQVALVKLDCGPIVFAHMSKPNPATGDRLALVNRRDRSGAGVFIAIFESDDEQEQLDRLSPLLLDDK